MTSLDRTVFDNSSGEPSSAGRAGLDAEAATAANLLTGLAARLRAAYEQGAEVARLAAACRRSEDEVRRLLQLAGADLSAGRHSAFTTTQPTQADRDRQQLRRVRRPTPSRRLSRLHPRAERRLTRSPEPEQPVAAMQPQTPLGILIGASADYTEPQAHPEISSPRRVPAELVRVGQGTSLVVLPSWRAAIAVSVPTHQILAATGLSLDELADGRLTVLMNPEALHDRELDLHAWQAETDRPRGRGRTR
ncbi:hypothetical protein GCM10010193_58220 [Kitasatospora atroaurantiaca]|uniref:Uncharacterized protein n=1 Tax=Kitasatospora atroaurantiaca TaxID=285545 RepID=A0A561EP48_9ACTN|nr:hypothetical protein [Kitasatospora atroaurantiaca]TWE17385.1 hypothetical protein FB465_2405 [Kitasatospora atroaurantiaca]